MKVLLINGSLRGENGNTLMISRKFIEGITEAADAEVTELHLGKMNIEHCIGCFACWKKTPGQCAIKDDMEIVRKAFIESDVAILSFPLYFFGLPSKMKAMLDRFLPLKMPYGGKIATPEDKIIMDYRYDFSDKKLILISSCAHSTSEIVYEPVKEQFNLLWGEGKYATIFCPQGEILKLDQMKPILSVYLNKVKEAGKELAATGILSEETQKKVCAPLVPPRAVNKMMTGFWESFRQE